MLRCGEFFNLCGVYYLMLRFMVCRSHVLNYDSVTICNGMEKVVRCPNKENIHVLQGFYGKWKNHDCNGIKIDPSNAHTCSKDRKETTGRVRNSCQGQNQCTFIADKEIYGDPCPESDAYLYVTFFCMEPGKQIDHQRDKNNQETVTVTTHGYLVSERKHAPGSPPAISPKLNEIMNNNANKPLVEKPNLATQEGQTKITIPKNEPNPSSGLANKLAQIQLERMAVKSLQTAITPIRDERKQITDPLEFRPANDSIEGSIRREEIFDNLYKNADFLPANDSIEGSIRSEDISDRMLRSSTICNGQSKLIACLPDEVVKVNGAFYGKKTGRDCNGDLPYKDDSPTCSALDARSNVLNFCNDRQTCLLFADENIYGKALCPNVNKYLHVDYICLPKSKVLGTKVSKKIQPVPVSALEETAVSRSSDPTQGKQNVTVQVCNGERHAISCRRDVGMQIMSAFYGKLNGKDCRGELGYRDDIPNCINPRALDSVKFLCENRKSCELASEKELFGDDTCPGVNKYLRVTYQC